MIKIVTQLRRKNNFFIFLLLLSAFITEAQNAIVTENMQVGTPPSQWDINGAGDLSIQGFATDISVNKGNTVHFKINTNSNSYTIDIYRLGYYQGNGARKVGTGIITVTLPQSQPAELYDPSTGLTDCGNWAESAHWDVPSTAVSGIYLAKLTRSDNGGASHIVFVVRDDASTSQLYFQTSDATWQAYNVYGGNSLYTGNTSYTSGHAAKVSYNRPFVTRNGGGGGGAEEDWLFNAEYPMIRWLERNGYDVSYTTNTDADRNGGLILNHKVFLSVGHDEYWSAQQRTNVEAARNAGVHLAFFSGNEIYWKTRWENSTDGGNTPYRTLVCYKEGTLGENVCGGKCDPLPNTWTGLWRDGCAYTTNDGCKPENNLTGQISWDGTTGAIEVSDTYKNLRFWRNTSVASMTSGQTISLSDGTLGYEWDWNQYKGDFPAGRIRLSSTILNAHEHNLSLYKHTSGALVFGAGTVQWSWGLDGNHDRGGSIEDANIQQATVNLFADMGVQPSTLQAGLVPATASTDFTAPVSVITSPVSGTALPNGSSVSINGTASDNSVVAGVEVSTDGGITWYAASGTTNWTYSWIPVTQGPVTIKSRAIDDSGNSEAEGTSPAPNAIDATVSAPLPVVCPCTIFLPTDVPTVTLANDHQPIELGTKFQVLQNGYITGIRYYKGAGTTGLHRGHIWNSTTLLSEATFTNETSSGWQEVSFPNPIPVVAGTTYLASYHSASGDYSYTDSYFTSAVVRGPIRFLADGEDGANGVYRYTSEPSYPGDTYQASNYWVDVVFNDSIGPDTIPPFVTSTSPMANATGVNVHTTLSATFSQAIDVSTLNNASFILLDPSASPVPATISYNSVTRTAILSPTSALSYTTTYSVTVKGGTGYNRIKDLVGNSMVKDCTWVFTTSAPTVPVIPPTEGPGGPILVISSAANPFSRYYAEILRAEGFNEFNAMDISQVNASILSNYEVIVLGEFPLSAPNVSMLTTWVNAGGTLIAMRPDAQLATLLGLNPTGSSMTDKYLLVNNSGAGAGIVNQTMQYHSNADLYNLNGATTLATLYSNASTATSYPAVSAHAVGTNNGQAIAFTYDLARSVVYTRQGNPAWAGQKRDEQIDPIRSDDQFYPDWIDMTKVAIPQADEQQHLLSNIILKSNLHHKPLPRFWFLPKGLKAAIVMTGDDHGDAGMQPRFDKNILESTAGCSVDDWDCIRSTGYLYIGSAFTNAMAKHYDSLGFEVALHVNTNCSNFTQPEYENYVTSQLASFNSAFPGISLPATNRNHCIAWSNWSTVPEAEASQGIRFDVNYYYWPGPWVNNQPGMFTGSGMPMRFTKIDGTIIDCYQAVTQMPDESGEIFPQFCDALLDKAIGPEGYYGVFTTNMHFDNPDHQGANDIVASAKAHHIPVVSAKQMLTWIDGRNNSSFDTIYWHTDTLMFAVTAANGSRNMQAMIPSHAAGGNLTAILMNGSAVTYTLQTIKGIEYAFIYSPSGTYAAVYGDTSQLHITSLSATPNSASSETITWTTDKTADSKVEYGTSPSSLNLIASNSALVTNHSVTLNGLLAGTTYYYRVVSKDASADSATSPDLSSPPQSFVTLSTPCAQDILTADFNLGTPDVNTIVTQQTDGEVTLKPAFSDEFNGTTLSGNWSTGNWNSGGTQTVSGGFLTVDGGFAATNSVFSPQQSLEFVANFQSATFQNVGFAADANFNAPWITIGQGNTAGSLYARSDQGTTVLLGTGLTGTTHSYRIEWNATNFVFYVDGVATATINQAISSNMIGIVSDFNTGGGMVQLDWMRVIPYAKNGSFTSRIFDYGDTTNWSTITWNALTPAGTSVVLSVRTGNSPAPDGSWSGFLPVTNGVSVGVASQYLQYRADLATTDSTITPVLEDVSIGCSSSVVCVPPTATISAVNPSVCFGSSVDLQLSDASGQAPYKLVVNGITYTNVAVGQTFASIKPTENSIWGNTGIPTNADGNDGQPIETGTKFKASVNGYVTGIRFYKGVTNTGTHTASLWSVNGMQLATTPFTSETASGWQEVHFANPVYVKADTTYIASYFSPGGTFAISPAYFTNSGVSNPPLTALQKGVDGPNGVYKYGGGFPNGGNDANYWVDVLFVQEQTTPQTLSYTLSGITDNANCSNAGSNLSTTTVTVNPLPNGTITSAGPSCKGQAIELVFNASSGTGPFTIKVNDSTYTNISSGVPFSTGASASAAKSIWDNNTLPGTPSVTIDSSSIEVGLKFRSTVPGKITGIRFYKGVANTGTHTGSLWSSTGSLLSTATFTNETNSGWQQILFATPVTIAANTTYIASYFAPNGRYAYDKNYFATGGVSNNPLKALQDGEDGSNGVYIYSNGGVFPNNSFSSSNYWVDVMFSLADSGTFTLNQISDANSCSRISNGNTIHVVQNPTYTISVAQSICSGDSILIGNKYRKTAGTYYDSLQTIKGCDSIRVIALNVKPSYSASNTASVCSGSSYTFSDGTTINNITSAVTHTNHFQKINGCDSLIITTVNIKPVYNIVRSASVCSGGNYTFPDGSMQSNITSVITHTSSLQTTAGCDSIIITTVSINPVYSQTLSASVCSGGSYTFPDGSVQSNITSATTYTSALQSKLGCDSVIITTLNVNPVYSQTTTAFICNHGSYTFPDGTTQSNITANTTHTNYLHSNTGCDSIVITMLNVNSSFVINETVSICSGSDLTFPDGFVQTNITADLVHISNLQSHSGCDSTITTIVTVNQKPTITVNATQTVVCAGSSVTLNGSGAATYTWSNGVTDGIAFTPVSSQTYTITGTDLNNCTNSATITISVNTLPVVTFVSLGFRDTVCISSGFQTFANGSPAGGTYSGPGVTGTQFDPSAAGVGTHTITYSYTDINLCSNTATHNVRVDSCNTMATPEVAKDRFIVYPNPNKGSFTISASDYIGWVKIYSSIGELVYEEYAETGLQKIDMTKLVSGIYLLEVKGKHLRIIKE
ncbi:MAG: DUF4082 domain-containing protein [Bacteroidia bacterium]